MDILRVLLRVNEQRILLLIPDLCLKTIFQEYGPDEAAIDTYKLELSPGFGYRTLPDGMMYADITCRPDIGYALTTMSKFSIKSSQSHYELLKGIT